jgi:hypothetical protein
MGHSCHLVWLAHVRSGSKGEILSASKSLPLLSQERTLAGLTGSVFAGGNLTPSDHQKSYLRSYLERPWGHRRVGLSDGLIGRMAR